MTDALEATRRPTVASAGVSLLAALAAVGLIHPGRPVRIALLVELGGLALLAAGFELRARERAVAGIPVSALGLLVALGSFGLAASRVADSASLLHLLPGMLGLLALSLGVVPAGETGSRGLVKLGTALVFAGVVVAGVFRAADGSALLLAGVATVVAWDAGENAINVGEHLGRAAATLRVELVHVGASAAVGALVVLSGRLLRGAGTPTLSLPALASLLVAAILLMVALHD